MPAGPKLRATPVAVPFHVVLVEPEIPPNTGAVARTCVATGSVLHLVGKLGFRIDEQSVRRAGLDYWPLVTLNTHATFHAYQTSHSNRNVHFLTTRAQRSLYDLPVQPGDAFVFGKESTGLDDELLHDHPDRWVAIPTLGPVRSLNLASAVAITLFEALRQIGAMTHTHLDSET